MACCQSQLNFSGHQGAVSSVTNQMKLKTREMPTLAAAASELGRRAYQGTINAIVATGIAREDAPKFCGTCAYEGKINAIVITGITCKDAPTFCGKRAYQDTINTIVVTGIAREEASSSEMGRRMNDSRRICTKICATENCKNVVVFKDHCGSCQPKKLKVEFCIGVGGRVLCVREIFRMNQCRECYYDPEEKKMREEKKAARPKCKIDGCGGNELRSYGLCENHYKKSFEEAKAQKM